MGVMLPTLSTIVDSPPGVPLIGYDNVVTPTNIFSISEADGFPVTNLANPATHLFWKGTLTSGSGGIAISPTGRPVDYIAIAGHNFGSAGIGVHPRDDSTSPVVPLLDAGFRYPTDDSPIIMRIPRATYNNLWVYLDVHDIPAQAAVVYCGSLLVLERGIKVDATHVPIPYGRRTRIVNGMSESGNFLGRLVLSESRESRAEFFGFTPTFYRASIDPFLASAQESPFFWAWAPGDYPLETGYSWLTSDAQPEVSPDHRRIALTLDMAGIS